MVLVLAPCLGIWPTLSCYPEFGLFRHLKHLLLWPQTTRLRSRTLCTRCFGWVSPFERHLNSPCSPPSVAAMPRWSPFGSPTCVLSAIFKYTVECVFMGKAHSVLTKFRVRTVGSKETKYIAVIYGPWGFQKCIWEPWVTTSEFHSKNILS